MLPNKYNFFCKVNCNFLLMAERKNEIVIFAVFIFQQLDGRFFVVWTISVNKATFPKDNSNTTKCITIVEINSARPIINGRWIIPPRTSSKVGQSSTLPLSGSSGGPQLRNNPPCIDRFFLNQNIHSTSS